MPGDRAGTLMPTLNAEVWRPSTLARAGKRMPGAKRRRLATAPAQMPGAKRRRRARNADAWRPRRHTDADNADAWRPCALARAGS